MSLSIHTILKRSHFTLALGAAALFATSGCLAPGESLVINSDLSFDGAGGTEDATEIAFLLEHQDDNTIQILWDPWRISRSKLGRMQGQGRYHSILA